MLRAETPIQPHKRLEDFFSGLENKSKVDSDRMSLLPTTGWNSLLCEESKMPGRKASSIQSLNGDMRDILKSYSDPHWQEPGAGVSPTCQGTTISAAVTNSDSIPTFEAKKLSYLAPLWCVLIPL